MVFLMIQGYSIITKDRYFFYYYPSDPEAYREEDDCTYQHDILTAPNRIA